MLIEGLAVCGREEIPLIQVKEQRLRFAGAAVKRYPTSKAPLSMGFSRQEYWSGYPETEAGSPTIQEDSFTAEPSGP
ncbi:hypothetical protein CapIbe_000534 [Capra ibex]